MTATTASTPPTFDAARADAFTDRMVGVLDDGALALLCSLGHQLGLFDVMTQLGSATSDDIADVADLDARYVQEWLGGVTTGGIVEHDPDADTFLLPPEHAACLTRAAGIDNLARSLRFLPLLAQVEERIVEVFRNGGGLPYSTFPDFHRIMAEDSAALFDAALIDTILPLIDALPARLASGIDVADLGCGSGHAVNVMATSFPASRFVGYDLAEEAIAVARAEAADLALSNVRFEVRDIATLADSDAFDLVTAFDAIHDQAHPGQVLANAYRMLRADGTFLMVDINASSELADNLALPWATFLYTVSLMHCMTVSLAEDGAGLGTVWGHQRAREMLAEAGFGEVEVRELETDPFNLYYIAST